MDLDLGQLTIYTPEGHLVEILFIYTLGMYPEICERYILIWLLYLCISLHSISIYSRFIKHRDIHRDADQ